MTTTEELQSIGAVSERTGLSVHTLRFYEAEDLFAEPVHRDAGGRRQFSEEQVQWLLVMTKLRATGMGLPDIHRYVELFRAGPSTEAERLEIFRGHEAKVRAQLTELQEALDVIEHKIDLYKRRMDAGTAGELWRDGPEC